MRSAPDLAFSTSLKHSIVVQGRVLFFLIYLPLLPAGVLSLSLLLLTGARRERPSTSFSPSAVRKNKQAALYLENRGSWPPDCYVRGRSQPWLSPSCTRGLKSDLQICRAGGGRVGLSLLT